MEERRMTKQEEFLWIVQAAMLANGINLASRPDAADRYRHEFSATGILGTAGDAVAASKRIPDKMSARDAACDFCGYMLDNLRDQTERAEAARQVCPAWFANLQD
ncbi:hypothetical protein BSA145_21285 (plasmid) [Bacillus safensis]|uniref:Uncharacterized protein n=1 Tax=Bacillus safensis TaxID=561879 RepID=A0A1L6ZPH0_BACIA|nr:hypothetical protein [Bacillus safensis]APT48402.1 hypothetical protein BSA145_21285 [Bacillus safensis]